ncbi:integrase [Rhizobium halophytocola]|uniref:Integrase n=1 Tax=Rhizobium halophytocola TaxID=735519 RepID=A0ABS4DXY2_9HYPH|nr:integrase [Rhizobium halophytocola]
MYVVKQKTRHGNWVFYFRIGKGKRIRLPDPGSPEFKEAYAACLRGEPIPSKTAEAPHTIAWLLARYMESQMWAELAPATRRQRSNIFYHVKEKNGQHPYSRITSKAIENGLDDRRATPVQANNYLKAMAGLCKWAVRNSYLPTNPTESVERLRVRSNGFPAWNVEDVKAYCLRWPIGTTQRLALEIAVHTGLRRSDLVRAGRQHITDGVLAITTKKTGARVTVELPKRVLEIIEATKCGDLHLLITSHGKPFSEAGFGNWFGASAREAGIEKNTHGIRKFAATTAANGGASAHELMSQFGWANSKQAEVYTRGADRARLGVKSSRIVSEQLTNILAPHPATGEGFSAKNLKKSDTKE